MDKPCRHDIGEQWILLCVRIEWRRICHSILGSNVVRAHMCQLHAVECSKVEWKGLVGWNEVVWRAAEHLVRVEHLQLARESL